MSGFSSLTILTKESSAMHSFENSNELQSEGMIAFQYCLTLPGNENILNDLAIFLNAE